MSNAWGKVAVGVRMGGHPDPFFVQSLLGLVCNGLRAGDRVLRPAIHMPHATAANVLVEWFLATDCDSLCFVDDDMIFDSDTLERLRVDDGGCDVLSVLYCSRRAPFLPLAIKRVDGRLVSVLAHDGILDCDVVGLGFTLIKRTRLALNCFEFLNDQGEDGAFCARVIAEGGKVGANYNVPVRHRVHFAAEWRPDGQAHVAVLRTGIEQQPRKGD